MSRPEPKGQIPVGEFMLASVRQDGAIVWLLRCPECGTWAEIDDDQYHGRVSVQCVTEGCRFHETHDFFAWLWRTKLPGTPVATL